MQPRLLQGLFAVSAWLHACMHALSLDGTPTLPAANKQESRPLPDGPTSPPGAWKHPYAQKGILSCIEYGANFTAPLRLYLGGQEDYARHVAGCKEEAAVDVEAPAPSGNKPPESVASEISSGCISVPTEMHQGKIVGIFVASEHAAAATEPPIPPRALLAAPSAPLRLCWSRLTTTKLHLKRAGVGLTGARL